MRKLIYLFFAVILAASCRAQCPGIPVKTAGIVYSCGTPNWSPVLKTGSEIDIDTTTGAIYQWHRTNNSWLKLGQGIDQIAGAMPPMYTPVRNQSLFAINNPSPPNIPELYAWTGSGWLQINQGTAYTAGTGIDITAGEITNTAPDQTVSITGGGTSSVTGTYPNFTVTSTEVDGSVTNEAQTLSAGGSTSPTIDLTAAGGAGGGTVTLSPGGTMSFSRTGNTITATATAEIPSQTGNSGKYLTTNGSAVSWGTVSAGITGSATATQVAYGSGTNAITSVSTFTYDGALLKNSAATSQLQLGSLAISSPHKVLVELDATRSQFVCRNASNQNVFLVRNDGLFQIGDQSGGFVVGAGTLDANVSGQFLKIAPPSSSGTSDNTSDIGAVSINGRGTTATSGFHNILGVSIFSTGFAPTSGTRQLRGVLINPGILPSGTASGSATSLLITPNINQTGSASGTIYGIRYSPSLTSILGAHYGLIIEPNCRNGIGTATPAASAALDITSTTSGFLPPRMTTAQRNAISSPATGLTLYCTDCTATDASTGVLQTYNGSTWKNCW